MIVLSTLAATLLMVQDHTSTSSSIVTDASHTPGPAIIPANTPSPLLVAPSTKYKPMLLTTSMQMIKVTSSIEPTPVVTSSTTEVLYALTSASSIAITDVAMNNAPSAQLTSATSLLINTLNNLTDSEVVDLEFSKVDLK